MTTIAQAASDYHEALGGIQTSYPLPTLYCRAKALRRPGQLVFVCAQDICAYGEDAEIIASLTGLPLYTDRGFSLSGCNVVLFERATSPIKLVRWGNSEWAAVILRILREGYVVHCLYPDERPERTLTRADYPDHFPEQP